MNAWPFVIGAYALTIIGTLAIVLWSYLAMRRAEADAEAVSRNR